MQVRVCSANSAVVKKRKINVQIVPSAGGRDRTPTPGMYVVKSHTANVWLRRTQYSVMNRAHYTDETRIDGEAHAERK